MQFPITLAYAFTDYRSQGQTIPRVIVDLATHRTKNGQPNQRDKLSLFNAYVALSRSSGRDFDESIFTQSHIGDLLNDTDRMRELNEKTKVWWNGEKEKLRANGFILKTMYLYTRQRGQSGESCFKYPSDDANWAWRPHRQT